MAAAASAASHKLAVEGVVSEPLDLLSFVTLHGARHPRKSARPAAAAAAAAAAAEGGAEEGEVEIAAAAGVGHDVHKATPSTAAAAGAVIGAAMVLSGDQEDPRPESAEGVEQGRSGAAAAALHNKAEQQSALPSSCPSAAVRSPPGAMTNEDAVAAVADGRAGSATALACEGAVAAAVQAQVVSAAGATTRTHMFTGGVAFGKPLQPPLTALPSAAGVGRVREGKQGGRMASLAALSIQLGSAAPKASSCKRRSSYNSDGSNSSGGGSPP